MGKIDDDYIIAVVTRGRVDTQFFLEGIPPLIRQLVTIVCHPGEREAHMKRWKGKVANIVEYGDKCANIGQARDWVMKYAMKRGAKYVIHIDDNVVVGAHYDGRTFALKNKLLTVRNNYSEDEQIHIYAELFGWMLDSLRSGEYGIVGISHRSGNNRKSEDIEENARLFAFWGIDVEKWSNIGIRFSDNPYKEDFHMQLAFLTSGIKTACNNCFTFDKARGANQSGGCSTYRNLENVNRGSEILAKTFPDFVSLVEKDSNNWSNLGGDNVKRLEVIIHWKKAYLSSVK